MSETITTTQLLDFLVKADKVSTHMTFKKGNGFHEIGIHCAWDDNNNYYTKTICITEEGKSAWDHESDHSFFTMSSMLDYLVEKEEEREMKRKKREELLSRLTDEEKELLGVK